MVKSQEVLERCLEAKGVSVTHTRSIKNVYDRVKTRERIVEGDSWVLSCVDEVAPQVNP